MCDDVADFNDNPVVLAVPSADLRSLHPDYIMDYVQRLFRLEGYDPPPGYGELNFRENPNNDTFEFQFADEHRLPKR